VTPRSITQSLQSALRARPALTLTLALAVLHAALAGERLAGPSANNHFAYLAESWLAGEVALVRAPPHGNDWASYEALTLTPEAARRAAAAGARVRWGAERGAERGAGRVAGVRRAGRLEPLSGAPFPLAAAEVLASERRYFVSFPPLPALLMAPLVWLFGLNASDVWLTLLAGALNGGLLLGLLGDLRARGLSARAPRDDLWLVALATLGSAHLWCVTRGEVWYTALTLGVTAHILFLRFALHMRRPLLAGLALAAAFATRTSLLLLALLFYAQVAWPMGAPYPLRERLRRAALFSLPPLAAGAALLWHNHARFESLSEFGHTYLAGGAIPRIRDYGLFHVAFFKKNVIAAFLLLPLIRLGAPPAWSAHGVAVQASSPGLAWALWALRGPALARALLALCAALLSLLLLYQNTGWVQFSWRFILDLLPSLVVAIALSPAPLGAAFKGAVLWGVAVNLLGAVAFGRGWAASWWVDLPALLP